MRKHIASARFAYFLAVIVILAAASFGLAQESQPWSQNTSPLPPPTGFVNDYAGVIDAATKEKLETRLKTFKETSEKHVEIAVAVVRTTGERAIFDYSLAVARGWKIGSKQDDNPSALLLVAVDDRKYFTQISKDLEDELSDGTVGSLQRQYLVPEFRKGNYSKGISDTVEAYIAAIESKTGAAPAGTPQQPSNTREGSNGGGVGFTILGAFCCAAFIIVIVLLLFSKSSKGPDKRDRDRWGGGGFGGGGSGGGGDSSSLPWIIGSILAGSSSGSSSSSSSSDWGGSSGGGSDWGGFGGGGDFGGGGAGGDW